MTASTVSPSPVAVQVFRRDRDRVGRGCAAILAVALVGCSFALDGPGSDWRPHQEPDCDRGKSAVGIDGVWAGVGGLVAIAGLVNSEPGVGVAGLLVGAVFAGAAYRGNATVEACRAADRSHHAWLAGQRLPIAEDEARPRRLRDDGRPRVDDTALIEPATPPPIPPPPATPKSSPPKPVATDEWDDFWQEVP